MTTIDERPARDRPRVMVIDDDDCLRDAMSDLLEARGYRVRSCHDGVEGLDCLASHGAPDLILLDLLMPHMNGWEFRVKQRGVPKWADIPLVVLTADTSVQAAAIHADAYLPKPVEQRTLLETVERVLTARSSVTDAQRAEPPKLVAFFAACGHALNDPLAYLGGNLELAQGVVRELEERLQGSDAFSMVGLSQLLTRVRRGAERIASLSRDLSAFCRLGMRQQLGTRRETRYATDIASRTLRRYPSVLVVDDEPLMCDVIAATLAADYNVATFTDARAALASMLQGSFDVILCDLTMAGLTGMEIYERLAAQRPALTERIIFMSAGVHTDRTCAFLAMTQRPQLHKPVKREDLLEMIEAQLTALH
jgi:CheY-like chemotaxis protein